MLGPHRKQGQDEVVRHLLANGRSYLFKQQGKRVHDEIASSAKLLQPLSRQQQGLVFLTETESHLLRAQRRIAVET